jgi:hypothetical protein
MEDIADAMTMLETLTDARRGFAYRPDVGPTNGLLTRMLRAYIGNPISYKSVQSIGGAQTTLPDEPRANSALIYVGGQSIVYRVDGTPPAATAVEQTVPVGSWITLTGQETIKGFIFYGTFSTTATLAVNYFD